MSESMNFDEDAHNLLEDENASESPLSKGMRPVPSWLMDDFLSWTHRYHAHISELRGMDYRTLQNLLYTYMRVTGQNTYSIAEWWTSLQKRL